MKLRLFIFLALILFSSFVFCQVVQNKWSAGCSFGIHFPQGDFEREIPEDIESGYAVTGYRISVPLTYFLWKDFGISAFLFSQKHDIDNDLIVNQLSLPPKDILKSLPWSFEGFLAGPYASFVIDEQNSISFQIKITGGLINAQLPVLGRYFYYYDPRINSTRYYLATTEQASDVAFAFLIDAGLHFRTGKQIALTAGVNYFSTKPEFKNIPVSAQGNAFTSSTYVQPVYTLGLDCGIAYLLK